MAERIPTSRVARGARVGRVAAGQAVKHAGMRAANLARSDDKADAALERRYYETADALVTMLGTMKGAAMKVGQMLSVLEVGMVPEEHREAFQAKLAALQNSAPKVDFKQMRKVIESDLGEKLSDVFEQFEEEPIGAASIGQVYRATLRDDGREVAVKVQYPGIDAAVRADLQNLGMIMRLVKGIAPGLDAKALTDEMRVRVEEELDYELEAQNQRSAARLFKGHPFIVVPDVITSLSRERVLVTEFVQGARFDAIAQMDQATRDRVGEIVFRFYFGSVFRHHQFSPDPHPGNFMLMDDGRVAFLDFGLYKHMNPAIVDAERVIQRAVSADDREEVHRLLVEHDFILHPDRISPDDAFAFVYEALWWYTSDQELTLTPEIATEVVAQTSDPRSQHFGKARHQQVPSEHLFILRMGIMVLAALGKLGVTNNWYRIASEWISDAEPVTELGREEAAFYAAGAA